jgi:hypothetical protein
MVFFEEELDDTVVLLIALLNKQRKRKNENQRLDSRLECGPSFYQLSQ